MTKTIYSLESLDRAILAGQQRSRGLYGLVDDWLWQALDLYPVKYQRVLLIGSANQTFGPFYEGLLLAAGVRHLDVTDYNQIEYPDNRVQFVAHNLWEHQPRYDAVVSISSIEHSGLGRYGDEVDPDADLKTMKQIKNVLAPTKLCYLSVPVGRDKVVGQWHRVYGKTRLPLLINDLEVVEIFGWDDAKYDLETDGWDGSNTQLPSYEPVLVLEA